MKKLFAVALAGVLAVSGLAVFAGCGELYDVPIDWNVDLSEPIALKGLYPETAIGTFGHDDTAKIIEQTTGYQVTYEELGTNADVDVNKYLNSRAQYHFMKLTEAQYHPYLEKGTFCDLTEILQKTQAGRTLYQLIDLMDYGWDSVTYVDSEGQKHIYGIPDFGYVPMTDSALIWNRDHLKQIGFAEHFNKEEGSLPETLSEFDWAILECQKKFGEEAGNDSYHALGLPGSNSNEITSLKGAFEVPFQFFVDKNGQIQQYEFSEGTTMYAQYMHRIRYKGILSDAWQSETDAGLNSKFARQNYSCVSLPYWNVDDLINEISAVASVKYAGSLVEQLGIPENENTPENVKAKAIGWQLRIRGDGFSFETDDKQTVTSPNQEVARIEGGNGGVSYYTVIPAYMQDKALYVVDFLAKKMEFFGEFYGGNGLSLEEQAKYGNDPEKFPENTHWYEVPTPASIVPGVDKVPGKEDYETYLQEYIAKGNTPTVAAEKVEQEVYNQFEDLSKRVIFLRPYSFTYKKYSNKDPNDGNVLSEDESKVNVEEVTVSKPGMWVQLTDRYIEQINDNSQYCNGTNAVSARVLFHLRETGFGAWRVVIPNDETLIRNPMEMCPPMENWSKKSILCRTLLKNGVSSAIDAQPKEGRDIAKETIEAIREQARSASTGYWTQAMVDEMTEWYNNVKLNRN